MQQQAIGINILNANTFEMIDQAPDKHFNLIVADPIFTESTANMAKLFAALKNKISDNGQCFVFIDWKHAVRYVDMINQVTGWEQVNWIVWSRMSPGTNTKTFKTGYEFILHFVVDKNNYVFNKQYREMRGKQVLPYKNTDGSPRGWFFDDSTRERVRWAETSNVWCDTRPTWSAEETVEHGMQKPLQLSDRIILSSTNEGDNILDCFAGSGTFACSAKMLNRNYVGIEINPQYVKMAKERLASIGELKGYREV